MDQKNGYTVSEVHTHPSRALQNQMRYMRPFVDGKFIEIQPDDRRDADGHRIQRLGVTGLMLYNPVLTSDFMPGWLLNVALWVHRIEAVLADPVPELPEVLRLAWLIARALSLSAGGRWAPRPCIIWPRQAGRIACFWSATS